MRSMQYWKEEFQHYYKQHLKTGKVSKYHFSDTKKCSKKKVIETAYSRGILPVKKNSKKFYPKKVATREFMAVTTARVLGFQANKEVSPKCKDKKKLKYPAEIGRAHV